MSIAKIAIKGGIWLGISKLLQQLSGIVVTTILARLLVPDDFGLIAMVNVYLAFIAGFISLGIGQAVINKHEVSEEEKRSAYYFNFILRFTTAIIVIISAPIAVSFFNEPKLTDIIWLLSLNIILSGFFIFHRKLLEKDLQFELLSRIDLVAVFGSGMLAVVLALLNFGVYSLVLQSIALNILYLILIRSINNWKPSFPFSLKISKIKGLVRFSIKYNAAVMINEWEKNLDLLVLGKIFNANTLGYYAFANNIALMPTKNITNVFWQTVFPTFSLIKNDIKKVKIGYLKIIQLISLVSFPIMTIVALFSKPIIIHIFGDKWLPASDLLAILGGVGALHSIDKILNPLLPAVNKENQLIFLNVMNVVLKIIALVIGASYGLIGAALAILFVKILMFIIGRAILKIYLKISFNEIFLHLGGAILGCLVMFFFYNFVILSSVENIHFVLQIILTLSVYILSITITNAKDIKYIYLLASAKTS